MLSRGYEYREVIVQNKDKRILWFINHTTLREFEVPLLVSFGYEVYTPKCIPDLIYEWSGSVDYTYDKTLTIPQDLLDKLNRHNFYEDNLIPEIASIINQYFGTVFCTFHQKLLDNIIYKFDGRVLLRAFGLDEASSYSGILYANKGEKIFSRIQLLGDRFWFSETYPQLHEVECNLIKSRKAYHPLGLPDELLKNKNDWRGGENKILFFCPRIKHSAVYYGKIYSNFKKNFGGFPHVIAGNQPIAVDDPFVVGFQSRETIHEWFRTFNVMFYHSEEPRHLHYHPLEAIAHGTPLLFMQKGILGRIGKEKLPGACDTIKDARKKISRILSGDSKLINSIRESQQSLLELFTLDYCREFWKINFVEKIMTKSFCKNIKDTKKVKNIGVFLPAPYRGGSLNGAKNIARMLHLGSQATNESINVVFSCVKGAYNLAQDFSELIELGIPVRETEWKILSKEQISVALHLLGANYELTCSEYCIPCDGISNFNECEFWLIISDRLPRNIAPLKPYGMVIYDYIQRYVSDIFTPSLFNVSLLATRSAQFVLTTTPATREDAIQYSGLNPNHVYLAPMEFNTFDYKPSAKKIDEDYFIWSTNASPHKNHLNALKALEIYYQELDGKFKVIITGPTTQYFMDKYANIEINPHVDSVNKLMRQQEDTYKNITLTGDLPIRDYIAVLASAKFLWHPTIIDNGTYSVLEAAYHNVPSLSSHYPQMQYINERFNLNLQFFNSRNPRSMALALKKMEEEYDIHQKRLPSKEFLNQFNYTKVAPDFWRLVRSLL